VRTEEQVYQRSIELEPRETEAVRVTRSVPFYFQSIRMTTGPLLVCSICFRLLNESAFI
jgi:hypothetical protein